MTAAAIYSLQRRVHLLEWNLLTAPPSSGPSYTLNVIVSTFTLNISQGTHGLTSLKGAMLLNPSGEEVQPALTFNPDLSVVVDSNIDLIGCTLILY